MTTKVMECETLVASNAAGVGTSNPISCYSAPIRLKAESCVSLQVTVHGIWGPNTPQLRGVVEISNDGVNFVAPSPAIDTGDLIAAGTTIKSGEVCTAWARFKATLTIPNGVDTGVAASTFSIAYETESGLS